MIAILVCIAAVALVLASPLVDLPNTDLRAQQTTLLFFLSIAIAALTFSYFQPPRVQAFTHFATACAPLVSFSSSTQVLLC